MKLQAAYAAFKAQKVAIAAVSMDDQPAAAQMLALTKAEFSILADPEGKVARLYGVYDLLGDSVAAPATFVIRGDRTIAWRYVGEDAVDRPTAEEILAQLAKLK